MEEKLFLKREQLKENRDLLDLTYTKIYNEGRILQTGELNEQIVGIKQKTERFHTYTGIQLMEKMEFHMGRKRMDYFPLK